MLAARCLDLLWGCSWQCSSLAQRPFLPVAWGAVPGLVVQALPLQDLPGGRWVQSSSWSLTVAETNKTLEYREWGQRLWSDYIIGWLCIAWIWGVDCSAHEARGRGNLGDPPHAGKKCIYTVYLMFLYAKLLPCLCFSSALYRECVPLGQSPQGAGWAIFFRVFSGSAGSWPRATQAVFVNNNKHKQGHFRLSYGILINYFSTI